jgi:hypothetical protein
LRTKLPQVSLENGLFWVGRMQVAIGGRGPSRDYAWSLTQVFQDWETGRLAEFIIWMEACS